MSSQFVKIKIEYIWHTDGALLVDDNRPMGDSTWIPRKFIRYEGRGGCTADLFDGLERNATIEIEVEEWIAKRKGLI